MTELSHRVYLFDPLSPNDRVRASSPGIDTWHSTSLMARALSQRLPGLRVGPKRELALSGGMHMNVDSVEVGLDIGGIRIDHLAVLLVDDGVFDILLGSDVIEHAFKIGEPGARDVRVRSPIKDDPAALAVELYPVDGPVELRQLELFIRAQRHIHNLALLATEEVQSTSVTTVDELIDGETEIPPALRLHLQWVDNGSIWLTMKSGSRSALQYMARLFNTGATAKLAQQQAEAQKAASEAAIGEATREATVERIRAEQERLRIENIAGTHAAWRKEVKQSLDFTDDMIKRTKDKKLQVALRKKRDEALLQLTEQALLPIVRNLPSDRPVEPADPPPLLLPPAPKHRRNTQ